MLERLIMHKFRILLVRALTALFISLFHIIFVYSAKLPVTPRKPMQTFHEPQILLKSYVGTDSIRRKPFDIRFHTQNHFRNSFLSKNGSDFVVNEEALIVEFVCEAYYPIAWTFPFPKQIYQTAPQPLSSKERRFSKHSFNNHREPVNQKFMIAILIVSGYLEFLGMNLTCSSVENKPELRSSIYIFFSGNDLIEQEEKTLQIFAEPSADHFENHLGIIPPPLILPCRPATPDMIAFLQKEMVTTSVSIHGQIIQTKSWASMKYLAKHITFDPKIGFTIYRAFIGNSIFGLYRCSVALNSDVDEGESLNGPFVYFNVTKADNVSTNLDAQKWNQPFESKSVINGRASIHMTSATSKKIKKKKLRSPATFTCCSGPGNKPPNLIVTHCEDPLLCKISEIRVQSGHITNNKFSFRRVNHNNVSAHCRKHILAATIEIIACKGENVNFVDKFVGCFHPEAGGPVSNRSARLLQDSSSGEHADNNNTFVSMFKYESAAHLEQKHAVAQKMIIIVGQKIMLTRKYRLRSIHIQLDDIEDYILDEGDDDYFENGFDTEFENGPAHYLEYNRDDYYQGESLTFMCFGLQSAYAVGARLGLSWENGTTQPLQSNYKRKSHMKYADFSRVIHLCNVSDTKFPHVFSIFGKTVIAAEGMSSADCWMPKRSSSKWDKVSKKIQILPSVAPKFVESANEMVYFYLGETGKSINCTVREGSPIPLVKIMRNGQHLNISWRWTDSETQFPVVGINVTGVFDKSKHFTVVRILFAAISHDHHTVFQCTAKNVNSTVTRVINIFVIDKPGMVVPIFLSLFTILLIALIGLGIKYWYDKRRGRILQSRN